jgi:hypothetical protein
MTWLSTFSPDQIFLHLTSRLISTTSSPFRRSSLKTACHCWKEAYRIRPAIPVNITTAQFFLDAAVDTTASPATPIAALSAVILTGFALVIATLWAIANRLLVATSPDIDAWTTVAMLPYVSVRWREDKTIHPVLTCYWPRWPEAKGEKY